MRILLIAYEYPPIVAAQSLRWFYLTNELATLGTEIHVLCPFMPALPNFPVPAHPKITEHRVWPGPFMGLSQRLAAVIKRKHSETGLVGKMSESDWTFRGYRVLRAILDRLVYPDIRSEWYPFARKRLNKLLREKRFDAVISSHEPGVDLLLGLWAKKRYGVHWIVDLADPLCAPYSPSWRRWLDRLIEHRVLEQADKIVLTTNKLRDVLIQKHRLTNIHKFHCIAQGAPKPLVDGAKHSLSNLRMNIVFTGNFYEDFRTPKHFACALRSLACKEIAVIIAGDNDRFRPMFSGIDNVEFIGRLGHFDCLALQREADLLLNIGNQQSFQIPGKIYEYMGTAKPIIHLSSSEEDPSAEILKEYGAGWVIKNNCNIIADTLGSILKDWQLGLLNKIEVNRLDVEQKHSWRHRAVDYVKLIPVSGSSCAILHDFIYNIGGAERLVASLSRNLKSTLITGHIKSCANTWPLTTDKEKTITLGPCSKTLLGRYLITAWRFSHIHPSLLDYNIVIYSGIFSPLAVSHQKTGRRIYYCHSPPRFLYDLKLYYNDMLGFPGRMAISFLDRWLRPKYEHAINEMDVIIANSENVRKRLKRYLNIDAVVVPPPIDTGIFKWICNGEYYVSTARLEDYKRVDCIVKAFLTTPSARLIVASGGSQEKALRELAHNADNIYFTSWISDKSLADLIGRCKAVIYIPTDEDFGMSPVEAMAAGKPVIGVAEGGLLETIINGTTGVLIQGAVTTDSLVSAIQTLESIDPTSMRKACEKQAGLFNEKVFIERIKEILH